MTGSQVCDPEDETKKTQLHTFYPILVVVIVEPFVCFYPPKVKITDLTLHGTHIKGNPGC